MVFVAIRDHSIKLVFCVAKMANQSKTCEKSKNPCVECIEEGWCYKDNDYEEEAMYHKWLNLNRRGKVKNVEKRKMERSFFKEPRSRQVQIVQMQIEFAVQMDDYHENLLKPVVDFAKRGGKQSKKAKPSEERSLRGKAGKTHQEWYIKRKMGRR